jgi:hypothetical protein
MKGIWFCLGVIGIVTCGGCSRFDNEWKAAMNSPAPTNSIEGAWSGEWRSEVNGHHGSLRCVVTKSSDATYRAHYRAHYKRILRFTYVATLNATETETNGVVTLKGEANLGKILGVYTYEGTATPTNFQSIYSCKYDHGRYEMTRPGVDGNASR